MSELVVITADQWERFQSYVPSERYLYRIQPVHGNSPSTVAKSVACITRTMHDLFHLSGLDTCSGKTVHVRANADGSITLPTLTVKDSKLSEALQFRVLQSRIGVYLELKLQRIPTRKVQDLDVIFTIEHIFKNDRLLNKLSLDDMIDLDMVFKNEHFKRSEVEEIYLKHDIPTRSAQSTQRRAGKIIQQYWLKIKRDLTLDYKASTVELQTAILSRYRCGTEPQGDHRQLLLHLYIFIMDRPRLSLELIKRIYIEAFRKLSGIPDVKSVKLLDGRRVWLHLRDHFQSLNGDD